MGINVEGRGDAVQVPGLRVTGGFFSVVGVQPLMGRGIRAGDTTSGAPPVVVLSCGFWQRRFGGHCDVVG